MIDSGWASSVGSEDSTFVGLEDLVTGGNSDVDWLLSNGGLDTV